MSLCCLCVIHNKVVYIHLCVFCVSFTIIRHMYIFVLFVRLTHLNCVKLSTYCLLLLYVEAEVLIRVVHICIKRPAVRGLPGQSPGPGARPGHSKIQPVRVPGPVIHGYNRA